MGYTKSWTPPDKVIPNNLGNWKLLMGDIHQAFLDAGLAQSGTPGQLDISTVDAVGANNTYAGFCEYLFTDSLQASAPVKIVVSYGFGIDGMANSSNPSANANLTPRCKVEVYLKGVGPFTAYMPQSWNANASGTTIRHSTPGSSFIVYNEDEGFFGFVYGGGSRGGANNSYGRYAGASFALFLERAEDSLGNVSGGGLRCYAPDITTTPTTTLDAGFYTQNLAISGYLGATAQTSKALASDIALSNALAPGYAVLDKIYCPAPELSSFRNLFLGHKDVFAKGSTFQVEVGAVTKTMICVGADTGILPTMRADTNITKAQGAETLSLLSVLMLYE